MNDSISPESFLQELGMNEWEVRCCNGHSIFTIRQLALTDLDNVQFPDMQRLVDLRNRAFGVIANHGSESPSPKKMKIEEGVIWGCMYIDPAVYAQIEQQSVLKSPYLLFQEYVECPAEEREVHLWKKVYHCHLEAAREWMKANETTISDADVFAYLIWRGAQSMLGRLNLTAGARAIPFFYAWLPGEIHGSMIELDKVVAREVNNVHISDRYACVVSVNLTLLCEKYDAQLFAAQDFFGKKLDTTLWRPMSVSEVPSHADNPRLYDAYNAGENLTDTVPHGCVVTPTGLIPADCLKLFPRRQVTEKFISL